MEQEKSYTQIETLPPKTFIPLHRRLMKIPIARGSRYFDLYGVVHVVIYSKPDTIKLMLVAAGTWTPRSQAYTNDPAAGTNIELNMADTSGFTVGDLITVSSSAGTENALVTVVHVNTHLTVDKLWLNHTTTNPLVKLASALPVERAYTNDPASGANIELNMASTTGFAVGDRVIVSSGAGSEMATITVVHVDTHLTVDNLTINHTTAGPMVAQVCQYNFIVDTSGDL
jgi:hydrogenase maturation factor